MASNKITRFKDSDHETYYTGTFRLGDDGKLKPVMGIGKKAKNNIRKFKRPKNDEAYGVVAKGKKKSKKKPPTNRSKLELASTKGANNIKPLQPKHQTVFDPVTGKLKIVKTL